MTARTLDVGAIVDKAIRLEMRRRGPELEVLGEIWRERRRQFDKHGDQDHLPDGTGPEQWLELGSLPMWSEQYRADFGDLAEWAKARTKAASQNEGGDGSITFEHILTEEWAEAIAESDTGRLRAELIQVAAVCVQWVQAIDRRAVDQ